MALPFYIVATGNVGQANGGEIRKITVTPAAAQTVLTLRQNGSGGQVLGDWAAAANGSSTTFDLWDGDGGLVYSGQLHATLTGASGSALVGL